MKRVSFNPIYLLIISPLLIIFPVGRACADSDQKWSGFRPPNCRCHSKNIKMVAMHKPFGIKDCSLCHQKPVAKQEMKKTEDIDSKVEVAKQRRQEEKICKECHILKSVSDEGNPGN